MNDPTELVKTFVVAATGIDRMTIIAATSLDPTSLVPIGTVTGMLVFIFLAFLRDSARNDTRADVNNAKLVAAAENERDRAITERDAERFRHAEELAQKDAIIAQLLEERRTQ